MRPFVVALLCAAVFVPGARAQEVTAGLSSYSSFGLDDLDATLPLSGELRVTIPTSERFAIEPFFTAGHLRRGSRTTGLEGFYGVQVRQRIERFRRPGTAMFVTYGVAGYYAQPGAEPPLIGHFGFGIRRRVFKALAVRPEIQLVTFHVVPIGARFVVGVSVDVGR